MAYRVFADTNVYLDVLLQRGDEWQSARDMFLLAENGAIEVFSSSSSLINLMYLMNTYKLKRDNVVAHMFAVLNFTKLVNPDNVTFEIALSSQFKDLEDAVQYYTALEVSGVSYFVTSNIKDYKFSIDVLPVVTPRVFMSNFKKGR
jgi:hypothetical protein